MENDSENRASTREKILKTTMEIIGNEGFQNVTVRKIAKKAKVNVALINYYFGSKDNVVNEALRVITTKLMECFKCLENEDVAAEARLMMFLKNYSDTAIAYPDVFRNFISQSINNYHLSSPYIQFLQQEGIIKLKNVIGEITGIKDDKLLFMRVFQLVSILEFPILLGNQLNNFSYFDYDNKETRYEYIELIMRVLSCPLLCGGVSGVR